MMMMMIIIIIVRPDNGPLTSDGWPTGSTRPGPEQLLRARLPESECVWERSTGGTVARAPEGRPAGDE